MGNSLEDSIILPGGQQIDDLACRERAAPSSLIVARDILLGQSKLSRHRLPTVADDERRGIIPRERRGCFGE